jgi:hypothetical protein
MVLMAFNILDTDGSGVISIDEMMAKYDFTTVPDVKSGKKTIREAAKEFMANWDRSSDGMVTYEEFEDYYKGVSASVDGDDYFELMIRNAWRIAGGEGAAANTANRRVLVTNRDGSQTVKTIENELGIKRGDKEEMMRRLRQQGEKDVDQMDLYGGYEDMNQGRGGARKPTFNTERLRSPGLNQVSASRHSILLCCIDPQLSCSRHEREQVLLLSLVEPVKHSQSIQDLPAIPTVATPTTKVKEHQPQHVRLTATWLHRN